MTKILVTGASGKLGSAIVAQLLEQGKVSASEIVAASRDPQKLSALQAKGIETRAADFNDQASLEAAFAGIDRVLLISTDELAAPGKRLEQHKRAVAAAVKAGVKHILYTSMPNPDKSLISFAPDHLGTEEAIKASGLPYTILRNTWYFDNYFMSMPHNLQTGQWFTSRGEGRTAHISRADCAAAAAAAIANPPAGNVIMTLTSEKTYSVTDLAESISKAAGKPLAAIQVTDEQLAGGMKQAGLPDFLIAMVISTEANIREGNFDLVTDHFEQLTGNKPQSIDAFFAEHKAALG